MKLAFLYAGQGSQKAGMGRDLYEEFPEIRDIFEKRPAGLDIKLLCFEADIETLSQTEYTQPCMGAFAAAVTRLLTSNSVLPQYAMGLSLGEYGALYAAGVFDADEMLETLAFRGQAMAAASKASDCAMTAVLGLDNALIERAAAETGGGVWCCNYNCPGQTVIGGNRAAVETAAAKCIESGARRCIPLNVSGPFHTPYMEPAAAALSERFSAVRLAPPEIPVIFNATGEVLQDGVSLSEMLVSQVKSPVRFEQSVRTLVSLGADTVIEIGPSRVLSGFVKKTAPELTVFNIETAAEVRTVVGQLKGA